MYGLIMVNYNEKMGELQESIRIGSGTGTGMDQAVGAPFFRGYIRGTV